MSDTVCLLGAGGSIATETARALHALGVPVRLVSRNPQGVNLGDDCVRADLLDAAAVRSAVAGCSRVALLAGLPYRSQVWARDWPLVMANTIAACQGEGASLLFFDNVYAYGAVNGPMTEATPLQPTSRKGETRAQLVRMLHEARAQGLPVTIARAPDFYGPKGTKSVANLMVFDALAKGKRPAVLLNADALHTLIYTADAGRATALLLTHPQHWNQDWHLPVDPTPLTQGAFANLAATHFGRKPGYTVVPRWVLRLLGLTNADIREAVEMAYQNERPYVFESSRFQAAFPDFAPTPYAEGLRLAAASYRS